MNNVHAEDFIGRKVSHEVDGVDGVYKEYGVIVNAWYDELLDTVDCYVAFYDLDKTFCEYKYKPKILHYALNSLELIE